MNNSLNQNSTAANNQPQHKAIKDYVYNFNDLLGQGNFSKVFKATHQPTNKEVAIKIIELSSLTNPRVQELLNTEASILKALTHPNIIGCEEILTSSRNCYIITELCNGGDLSKRLKEIGLFRERELYQIAVDVFEGLKYLSNKNIVHRDIKIANIFINNGVYKIADFGFAQMEENDFKDVSVGSPIYMSPEGYIDNIYGKKTDIWAFGVLLFELVEGRTPCQNCRNETELKQNLLKQIDDSNFRSCISLELKKLIIHCLNINLKERADVFEISKSEWMQKAYLHAHQSEISINQKFRENNRLPIQRRSVQIVPSMLTSVKSRRTSMNLGTICPEATTNIVCTGQQTHKKSKTSQNKSCFVNNGERLNRFLAKESENFENAKNFEGGNSETSSESKNSKPSKCKNQFEGLEFKNGGKMAGSHTTVIEKRKDFSKGKTIWIESTMNELKLTELEDSNYPNIIKTNGRRTHHNTRKSSFFNEKGSECEVKIKKAIDLVSTGKNTSFKSNFHTEKEEHHKTSLNPSSIKILCKSLKFSDCISLIHYCRLCYKFSSMIGENFGNQEAKVFLIKWTIQLLTEIHEIFNTNERGLLQETDNLKINKLKEITFEYLIKYQKSLKSHTGEAVTVNETSMYIYDLYMKEGFKHNERIKNNSSITSDTLLTFLSLLDKETRNLMEFSYGLKTIFDGKSIENFLNVRGAESNGKAMKENKENFLNRQAIL